MMARRCIFGVATTPTVYGIETRPYNERPYEHYQTVATAPTVYGIETVADLISSP